MAKIKINESQYNAILLSMVKTHINEDTDKSVLEEGPKDLILGIAMLLNQALGGSVMAQSGHNKDVADKALRNTSIMSQIKSTLEDEGKTKELVNAMAKLGMKDPSTLLAKNAEEVANKFNKIAKNNNIPYNLDIRAVDNLKSLNSKLQQGYALKKVDTIKADKATPVSQIVNITDTVDVKFGSDSFFNTGSYEISKSGADTIRLAIDAITKQGGRILNVIIESSTDAEQIPKFITSTDQSGNIKLANLRANSVSTFINQLTSNNDIKQIEIPNNGSNVVSTKDFKAAANDINKLKELRNQTKQYRYVKLSIVAVFETKAQGNEPAPQLINKYRYEVVKVIESSSGGKDNSTSVNFGHKNFKCKKNTSHGGSVDCATF